jgi:hypothetical protein
MTLTVQPKTIDFGFDIETLSQLPIERGGRAEQTLIQFGVDART